MDRYQVVTLQAAVYVVDNDEMQASRFAGDWNAHASCELLNSGAMPRTDLDWIDLEPESADPVRCPKCGGPHPFHDPACVVHPDLIQGQSGTGAE